MDVWKLHLRTAFCWLVTGMFWFFIFAIDFRWHTDKLTWCSFVERKCGIWTTSDRVSHVRIDREQNLASDFFLVHCAKLNSLQSISILHHRSKFPSDQKRCEGILFGSCSGEKEEVVKNSCRLIYRLTRRCLIKIRCVTVMDSSLAILHSNTEILIAIVMAIISLLVSYITTDSFRSIPRSFCDCSFSHCWLVLSLRLLINLCKFFTWYHGGGFHCFKCSDRTADSQKGVKKYSSR